jgi:hypothetical protein
MMTFSSALEDLRATTLKSITGSLRRLEYLAGLRDESGTYDHWGLTRVYGQEAANKALEQGHRLLVSYLLSTPVQRLLIDVEQCSQLERLSPAEYLQRLSRGPNLLPADPGAGSERHFNSVLLALSSLVEDQPGATRQTS